MWIKLIDIFYYDRNIYENILDDQNNKAGNLISNFITMLVVFFALALIFESIGNNNIIYYKEILFFEAFISMIFALEYLYRIMRASSKISFFFNPMRIIDLLSFLPFFLGLFAGGNLLVILRLLRVLRVLRLVKRIPLTAGFINSLKDYLDEYRAVFILFLVILFLGSSFVYYAEKDVIGTSFTSIPITLWWGLVTMTTVGFGDMYPLTNLGKIFGSFLVFFGPMVLALFSAVTIMVFMETTKKQELLASHRRGKNCHRCKTKNPKEANFCFKCGEELKSKFN